MESGACQTLSGGRAPQGFQGVRERARRNKQERFTALLHPVTPELPRASCFALKRKAAPGTGIWRWRRCTWPSSEGE